MEREKALLAMTELQRLTQVAFDLSVRTYGCVECAAWDIEQRVAIMASTWDRQGLAEQTVGHPPMERDGIKRRCSGCARLANAGDAHSDEDGITDEDIPF